MAFSTHQIVRLLIENEVLVEKWQEFVGELNLQTERITQWKFAFRNSTILPYELFTEILVEWKSKTGRSGTLETLVEVINNVDTPFKYEIFENSLIPVPVDTNNLNPSRGLVFFGVPACAYNFAGRDQELSELQQTFQSPLKYALVCGLGGIGKTELVKKFAHNCSKHHHVTWFNGDTPTSLTSSMKQLADHLGIQISSNEEERKTMGTIGNRLDNKRWLMIIDNVDEIHEKYRSVLEFSDNIKNLFVVVTSQSRSVLDGRAELIEMDNLLPEDAFKLVKNSIRAEKSEEQIKSLCFTLQNFPLALQQAIAYIIQQQRHSTVGRTFGIQDYLNEFNCLRVKIFERTKGFSGKTILITWNLTLERLRRNDRQEFTEATTMLNILSFVNPDQIHQDFLFKIYLFPFTTTLTENKDMNKKSFEFVLETLKNYSIIKVEDNIIGVHRLVQELIRFHLDENTKTKVLDTIITNLDVKFVQKTDMQHILNVWKHIQNKHDLFIKHKRVTVNIYNRLYELSLYFECLRFAENNFQLSKENLGEDDYYTLVMQRCIATSTLDTGRYEEALEQFRLILPNMQRILGKEHEATLMTANNMARTLDNLKRYSEALEIYYEILQVRIKNFGKDNKDTITTNHNIAVALSNQGNYSDSMPLFQKVFEWKKNKLGLHNPFTLNTRRCIAFCLFRQSKYEEALIELENILELSVHLGEEHEYTLNTKSWLADTLRELGQEEKALKMHNEILPLRISTLGEDHPETIYTKSQIQFLTQKKK